MYQMLHQTKIVPCFPDNAVMLSRIQIRLNSDKKVLQRIKLSLECFDAT